MLELDVVDSTQDRAKKEAAQGAPHGTVIWAKRQTAGRGQFDRKWESPEGNLYFSMILRRPVPHERLPALSVEAARALARCLTGVETTIKPPNDVYAGGRKLAGVLTETSFTGEKLDWIVIGVGLNVAAAPPYAVSLKELTGRDWDVRTLLDDALRELGKL